jgi:hypothetical protein
MPLTERQKRLLVIGGLTAGGIAAAALIASAMARPPLAPPPPPPGYGRVECKAYADTTEVSATVEISGVGVYTTPFTADLKPGTYTFKASYDGQTKTQKVTVVEGITETVTFTFAVGPPTYLPTAIKVISYPTTMVQLYGFYYTMPTIVSPQCLAFHPLISWQGPPYSVGIITYEMTAKLVDAMGRGVPNQPLLFWSVPTRDDQTGVFLIDGLERPYDKPLRKYTDANGEATVALQYMLTDEKIKLLEDRLRFGCCGPLGGWLWDIDVGDCCHPILYHTICSMASEGKTDPRSYVVHIALEGTTLEAPPTGIVCYAWGKKLW